MDAMHFNDTPSKSVVDYDAIAAHVKSNGYMLLKLDINWNAMHTALHARFGLGLRKVVVVGEHVGWSVQPLRKHTKARAKKDQPINNGENE